MPYRKPDQVIEYININSNHPRHVLKNTVAEVAKRLSTLSSSKEIFDATKGPEQEALRRAGYMEELTYQPEVTATPRRRQRKRKVVWFNPPYCMSLKTKVGQKFLHLKMMNVVLWEVVDTILLHVVVLPLHFLQ